MISPATARWAPTPVTMMTKMPGSSTWAASSVAWMPDSRTPGVAHPRRTERRTGVRKVSSPPMPRSTRSPATVSAPSEVSSPASCRWAAWRRWSGRMTRVSDASSTGPPTSMMTPSTTEPCSRMTDTTRKLTMAPAIRAVTS